MLHGLTASLQETFTNISLFPSLVVWIASTGAFKFSSNVDNNPSLASLEILCTVCDFGRTQLTCLPSSHLCLGLPNISGCTQVSRTLTWSHSATPLPVSVPGHSANLSLPVFQRPPLELPAPRAFPWVWLAPVIFYAHFPLWAHSTCVLVNKVSVSIIPVGSACLGPRSRTGLDSMLKCI